MLTSVSIRMEDASSLKRNLYTYFMRLAKEVGPKRMDGESIGFFNSLLWPGQLVGLRPAAQQPWL